ncbi:MAG: hypothetical protein WBP59_10290 [Ilumatobacteraceae bacterium]
MTDRVVGLVSSPDTFEMRCMAAQLHLDGRGFLSAWTAGRIHGLRRMRSDPIHLTIPETVRRDVPSWVEVSHCSWFDEADRTTQTNGLVVATPLRMLFGLAAVYNQYRFERAAEDAWHRQLLTPTSAADYLQLHRCRGKNGVTRMRIWLERALDQSAPAESGLEQLLLESIEAVGLPTPVRQHRLTLPSGEEIRLDIAWPTVRLAVEPGAAWWHGGDLRQRHDQARDRACSEEGWHIIRFDDSLRDDPMAAARQIQRIHSTRSTPNF